jgi:hypothetical protein
MVLGPGRDLAAFFYLKNQPPTDPQFVANLAVVLARSELFADKLVAGMIHGD